MVYVQPRICPGEWDTQTPMGFWDINGSPNLGQTTRPYNNQQQQKENLQNCGLCCPGWPLSDIERKRKETGTCQGIEKTPWNMKVRVIPIVIGVLSTAIEWLVKELNEQKIIGLVESIQTRSVLRSARILRRVLETWGDLLLLKISVRDHQLTLIWETHNE